MGIIFFVLVGFCICTFCMYRSPCQQLLEMKDKGWEWNAGKDKTPPVWGVCGCSFLGISCVGSWLSCSDSVLLFIPCGPGSVRGCESISAILLCHIAFSLVPVGHHRWARCEVCLRYFTKSLRATVFMQTVYSTVVRGYS